MWGWRCLQRGLRNRRCLQRDLGDRRWFPSDLAEGQRRLSGYFQGSAGSSAERRQSAPSLKTLWRLAEDPLKVALGGAAPKNRFEGPLKTALGGADLQGLVKTSAASLGFAESSAASLNTAEANAGILDIVKRDADPLSLAGGSAASLNIVKSSAALSRFRRRQR